MTNNYWNGIAPILTAYGPGNVHHLSYASPSLSNVVGQLPTPTTACNTTNFLLGFVYDYTGYSFYWDGEGPAFWRMADSSSNEPVGTSWANATSVPWGTGVTLGADVRAQVSTAVNRDDRIIAYIIPGGLD
ncbi:hypothetical protein B0H11DRAFT_769730 [Mycena galericulata]|nr:hypothetical protein B0H11DRAFT_769730 [Mycena galericulata]